MVLSRFIKISALVCIIGLSGCDRPFTDPATPDIDILSPDFSSIIVNDLVTISISAAGFRAIASATVNGEPMTLDPSNGNWSIDWNLVQGVNRFDIQVTDVDGGVTDTTEYATRMSYVVTPRLNSMKVATGGHATTTTFNGALLVTGGTEVAGGTAINRVEILPAGSTVFQTASGTLVNARSGHTSTLLPDGRILIAGGSRTDDITSVGDLVEEPEIFNPDDQSFEPMFVSGDPIRRSFHTASTRLVNGSIILDLYGGVGDVQYSPESRLGIRSDLRSFQVLGDSLIALSPAVGPNLPEAISGHTQTPLQSNAFFFPGEYLISGSWFISGARADVGFKVNFGGQTGIVTEETAVLSTPRTRHAAERLGNDTVIFWGGRQESRNSALNDAELYVPQANRFILLPFDSTLPPVKRYGHTATLLFPGRMIVVGGYSNTGVAIPHVEIFDYQQ
ncbi:MAG: hypothetical protein HKN43_01900 [Rhodothermales bacterium]|nr:hypothetical protein [Rhodothermales bacterium]